MIERNFAEMLEIPDAQGVDDIRAINVDEGVKWLFSFLSADQKKTYCLYESPGPEAIRAAAERAGVPADVIIEVTEINPELISPST
jgi:hypothetical protein